MESLETLVLQTGLGSETGFAHLRGANSLKALQVSVQVTEEGLRQLAELPNLEELRANVRLNRPVIRELARMKSLKQLDTMQAPLPAGDWLQSELKAVRAQFSVGRGGGWRTAE
jgi:hypothetical protein